MAKDFLRQIEGFGLQVGKLEAELAKVLRQALLGGFNALERRIISLFKQASNEGTLAYGLRMTETLQQLERLLSSGLISPSQSVVLRLRIENTLRDAGGIGGDLGQVLLNRRLNVAPFSGVPAQAIAYQAATASERLSNYSTAFRNNIVSLVGLALSTGSGVRQVKNALRDSLIVSATQAETLARTEVFTAFQGAAKMQMVDAGVDTVMWLATLEGNVCGACLYRNGSIYRIGDIDLPLHPRCRCIAVPIWPEDMVAGGFVDEVISEISIPDDSPAFITGVYGFERKLMDKAPTPVWTPAWRR